MITFTVFKMLSMYYVYTQLIIKRVLKLPFDEPPAKTTMPICILHSFNVKVQNLFEKVLSEYMSTPNAVAHISKYLTVKSDFLQMQFKSRLTNVPR